MRIVADEQQLNDINSFGKWWIEQTDETGRIIGKNVERFGPALWRVDGMAWKIALIHSKLRLAGKKILEVGCLDGMNTVSLCAAGAEVTAMDIRPLCLAKAMLRCAAFGYQPRFMLGDVRTLQHLSRFDLLVHAGVLYHLQDPVSHVYDLARHGIPIVLDTNLANPERVHVEIQGYRGHWQGEGGWADEVSGAEHRSFWLAQESLERLMTDVGFTFTNWWEGKNHRGLPRAMYYLEPPVEEPAS